MKRLAIIGGSGFLGRHLIKKCKGWYVTNLDINIFADTLNAPAKFHQITANANNHDALIDCCKDADIVWIKVGILGGTRSVYLDYVDEYIHTNTELINKILEVCVDVKCNRIVFDSTEQVWGISPDIVRQDIDVEPIPRNFYGASKLISEKMLQMWVQKEGRSVQIFRYSRIRDKNTPDVIYHMVKSCLAGKPISITTDPNLQISFVHIDDVINSNLIAMNLSPKYEIYQVSSGHPYSLLEIANIVQKLVGYEVGINLDTSNDSIPFGPMITGMKWKSSSLKLGYHPKYDLNMMVQETVDWIRLHGCGEDA
jgi:nucleoside-diphosphate-sugar epimerase